MADPQRIRSVFLEAVEGHAPGQWGPFLDRACGGDRELRDRVEVLLRAHDQANSLLDPGAGPPAPTIDRADTAAPGAVVDRYKLLEQLGEGGFGVVFLAEQSTPVRRKVALKVLKPGMDSRPVVARFEAERQALALMDHPHIARVFDGGATAAGRPYFVMELVRGVPITEFCDQNKLPPRQRLALFVDVCAAVQHAHQKGVIHRDLKPSNILVSRHDTTPVVKVIDFGVAKALGQELTDRTLHTGVAQMVGTPLYMSPEQAGMSDLDVDTRSDVYSLGVLLYELLTGTTPFDKERFKAAGYDEIRRVIREEEPPKPSTRLSTLGQKGETVSAARGAEPRKLSALVRGELDWIVMTALEKDRTRRYETATGLAMDVQRYLADEPVQACPPSAGYRLRKFARRNKRALATAALLGLALLVAVGAVAGSLGWMARDRSARQVRLNAEAELALQEASRSRDLALTHADNPYQWEATLATGSAALKRAEGVAAQDESALDPGLRDRMLALRATLDADENDRRFVAAYEDIRVGQSELDLVLGEYETAQALPQVRAAFKSHYGVAFGVTPVAEVKRLIETRPRPVREHLLAALDLCWTVRHPRQAAAELEWLKAALTEADPDPWRTRARKAYWGGDWPAFEKLVAESPADLPAVWLRVWMFDRSFRKGSAEFLGLMRQRQQANPGDFWANADLARAFRRAQPPQREQAIRYYTAAAAMRPRSLAVLFSLAGTLEDHGDYDGVISTGHRLLAINRTFAGCWNILAKGLLGKGRPDDALTAVREAIRLQPEYHSAYLTLGRSLAAKDRTDEAMAAYREAIRLNPDSGAAHNNLGNVLAQNDRFDEAITAYQEALRIDPDYAIGHNNLGLVLKKRGFLKEAVVHFQEAIRLRPDYAIAHLNLGTALKQKGLGEEAVAAYREAIRFKPDYDKAYYNLGNALFESLNRADEAVAAYREAVRLNSKYALAHAAWAVLLATCPDPKWRDPVHAVTLAKKAVALSSKQGYCWYSLGLAQYRAENWKDSIVALQKSMDLTQGGTSSDWFFLAMAQWKLGHKDEARKWYGRAVEWTEKNQPTDEAARRLRAEASELLGVAEKGGVERDPPPRVKK